MNEVKTLILILFCLTMLIFGLLCWFAYRVFDYVCEQIKNISKVIEQLYGYQKAVYNEVKRESKKPINDERCDRCNECRKCNDKRCGGFLRFPFR